MAAAAAKKHTSQMKNPAPLPMGSKTPAKTNTAKKKPSQSASGRGTTTKKTQVKKRNPTGNAFVNVMIAAFGGALAITGFDYLVEYFAPTVSGTIKTGAKFVAGWTIGNYGRRIPIIGAYSGIISNTLYIFGFADLITDHLMPAVRPYLPGAAPRLIAQPKAVQDPTTGELGWLHELDDGSQYFMVDANAGQDSTYQYQ